MIAFIFNLFDTDKSNAGLEIFLMLLVAFLLGWLLHLLTSRGGKDSLIEEINRLKGRLSGMSDLESERDSLLSSKNGLEKDLSSSKKRHNDELGRVRTDKTKLQKDYNDLKLSMDGLYPEEEVMGLRRRITELEDSAKNAPVAAAAVEGGVDPAELALLKSQLANLKSQNATLSASAGTGAKVDLEGMVPVGELDKLRMRINDLERQNNRLRDSNKGPSPEIHRLRSENEELAHQKDRFLSEKLKFEKELEECRAEKANNPFKAAAPAPAPAAPKAKPAKKKLEDLTSIVSTLSIDEASAGDADDLKLISGVGPFIEKKLNAIGIYTFNQVSKFNADDVQKVTDAIQFFPGRIQRDDWVTQATGLHKEHHG